MQAIHDDSRLKYACEPCHARKIRCFASPGNQSGTCDPCSTNDRKCLFALRNKTGRPTKSARHRPRLRSTVSDGAESSSGAWGSQVLDLDRELWTPSMDTWQTARQVTTPSMPVLCSSLNQFSPGMLPNLNLEDEDNRQVQSNPWQFLPCDDAFDDILLQADANRCGSGIDSLSNNISENAYISSDSGSDGDQQYTSLIHESLQANSFAPARGDHLKNRLLSSNKNIDHVEASWGQAADILYDAYGTSLECAYRMHELTKLVVSPDFEPFEQQKNILSLIMANFQCLADISARLCTSSDQNSPLSLPQSVVWSLYLSSATDAAALSERLFSMHTQYHSSPGSTLFERLHRSSSTKSFLNKHSIPEFVQGDLQSCKRYCNGSKKIRVGASVSSIRITSPPALEDPQNSLNSLITLTCMDYYMTCFKKLLASLCSTLSEGDFRVRCEQETDFYAGNLVRSEVSCGDGGKNPGGENLDQVLQSDAISALGCRFEHIQTKIRSQIASIRLKAEA